MASKKRALLLIWPSWLLVSWGIVSIVFKIGDLIAPRPATMGGEIVLLMTCSLVAGLAAGITIFGLHYSIGRIRSWYGHKSPVPPPDQVSTDKF